MIQKIDYFTENDAIIPDISLSTEGSIRYFTQNGREVNAHGGIEPDFDVDFPDAGLSVIELWRQGMFYQFATEYVANHPDLDNWNVDEVILQQFYSYLDSVEFEFESDTQKDLVHIREDAEHFNFGDEFMEALKTLESKSEMIHQKMLEKDAEQIRERIEIELASLIGGSASRVEASLAFDPQVKKSLEILLQEDIYAITLTTGAPVADETVPVETDRGE